ncbi:hypothetical protein L3Q65_00380 (plasmid) [Amycolatopsis sp. FU40]|uniref:hypothetical protein n=1 Tax=Amycolatopsis sp. FU40 TaxID=2914159 RepID=UPI001F1D338F|nr:hypothetical protein [Amycolatopsis sp. FU40]UKD50785.1 hypothetical protein L3Q65_00380 [Amycolatopsis sp. FU40]
MSRAQGRQPWSGQVPAGLSVTKLDGLGWRVVHTASGLPLHTAFFHREADIGPALDEMGTLGIDWNQPVDKVRADADSAAGRRNGGEGLVKRILTPPEERERRRRVAANSTRYLRTLEAAGEQVIEQASHGMAGTVYVLTCGCQRLYSVDIIFGEPVEDLAVRCDRHFDLTVPITSTDFAVIRRELVRASTADPPVVSDASTRSAPESLAEARS